LIIVKRHPANLVESCIIVIKCNSFFLLLKSFERKENSRVAKGCGNLASKKDKKEGNPKPYLTYHSSASHYCQQ
jgi:hypothetical protein